MQNPGDAWRVVRSVGVGNLFLGRYLSSTIGRALDSTGLREDRPLVGLLSMLVEDTVHSTVVEAPLINAALGITIRGAGLTRAHGGMRGFWRTFTRRYRQLGGELRLACTVEDVAGREGDFVLTTSRGTVRAARLACAVPAEIAHRIGPPGVAAALAPFLRRDTDAHGGAVVVTLGVPEEEVMGQSFTHHQLLQRYDAPLGNGNNMFVSVSAPGDYESAPVGYRAVMISTHCELGAWEGLTADRYQQQKHALGEQLAGLARRVYPDLGRHAAVFDVGTPLTYARYTRRPRGAVGGIRLTGRNANQHAIPHELGVHGFWMVGDTTWPGLGTVACVLGSRIVAAQILGQADPVAARAPDRTRSPEIVGLASPG
jgi:phytoene dehydrogenase-like protein